MVGIAVAANNANVAVLRVLYGALIWAVHFAAVYGATSWLCTHGGATLQWLGVSVVKWTVVVVSVLALAACAVVIVAAGRAAQRGFWPWITAGVAALAALAIAWEALTAMLATACE